MPYEGERARGLSISRLMDSRAVREFDAEIVKNSPDSETHSLPQVLVPECPPMPIRRLLALDGSTVQHTVENGFPGAEACVLNFAAVLLELENMRRLATNPIPSPRVIRDLERDSTLSSVLPGRNIIGKHHYADSPRRFFRYTVYRDLSQATLASGHETLLETLQRVAAGRVSTEIRCANDGCERRVVPTDTIDTCECGEPIFPTDGLRAHERFEDYGSSAQAYTAVQTTVEHLALLNIMRWLELHAPYSAFNDTGFVLDGPLAIFGMPAWLASYVQREIERIDKKVRRNGGHGVLLMGVEKTGMFVDHLATLDWTDSGGKRSRIPNGTAFVPDKRYIHQSIVLRPLDAKFHGEDTYYGRHILYKSRGGQHAVVTTPQVNEAGHDPDCVEESAFPRIADVLDLLDELGTFLYQDGFAPLVRAHAHAAIPLRVGTELLSSFFGDSR